MTKQQITKYLKMLNDQLAEMGIKGEICLYGGAAMCLAFNARQATKDVDAVFKPEQKIQLAALLLLVSLCTNGQPLKLFEPVPAKKSNMHIVSGPCITNVGIQACA